MSNKATEDSKLRSRLYTARYRPPKLRKTTKPPNGVALHLVIANALSAQFTILVYTTTKSKWRNLANTLETNDNLFQHGDHEDILPLPHDIIADYRKTTSSTKTGST